MDSTAHVKMHKHKRGVQRSTTSNDALVVEVDEQPPTNLKSDQEDAIDLVLSCPDLLVRIIVYVADGTDHQSLSKLSGVSKSFKKITKSDQFWRELCYHRWRGKWGFHKRWEKALAEYEDRNVDKRPAWQRRAQESMDMYDIECGQEKRSKMYESKSRDDYFWECRYSKEELDGIRKYMRDDELESFVFDFRYWSVQEAVWDDNRPFKLASGLYQSSSEVVRFVNTHESIPGFDVGPLEIRGKVVGYPKYGHGDNELEVECKLSLCNECVSNNSPSNNYSCQQNWLSNFHISFLLSWLRHDWVALRP